MRWWDTQTLPCTNDFVGTVCTYRHWGHKNFGHEWSYHRSFLSHLVEFPLPNFLSIINEGENCPFDVCIVEENRKGSPKNVILHTQFLHQLI